VPLVHLLRSYITVGELTATGKGMNVKSRGIFVK
jgi:hypothetical protein